MLRMAIIIFANFAKVKVIANFAFEADIANRVSSTAVTSGALHHDHVPQEVPADIWTSPALEDLAVVVRGSMGRQ